MPIQGHSRKKIQVIIVRCGPNIADLVPSTVTLPPSLTHETPYNVSLSTFFGIVSSHYEYITSSEERGLRYFVRCTCAHEEPVLMDVTLGEVGDFNSVVFVGFWGVWSIYFADYDNDYDGGDLMG
ncbi:hypothetical protein TWF506_004628 [Arthrobotrys conoides]|uniref:Uncharacterized protein n=1 Tax=Arthrobotrys conoides TaxID=74498 RepID=A0AAN8N9P5_9PEZI